MTTLKWHLHGWMNLPVKIYFRANKPILNNKVYWVLLGRISNGSICQTKLRFLVYITSMRAELLLIVWKTCCSIFHRPIKICLNPIPTGGGPIRPPPMVFPLLLLNRWAKDDGVWVTFPKIYLRNLWNLIFWNPFITFLSIVSFRRTTFLQNWLNKCFRFLYNNRSNPKSNQYFFEWFELEVIR